MTNQQILKKAIKKAVKNGYRWDKDNSIPTSPQIVRTIIFDHSFAKAFWGEKGISKSIATPEWQYHLQQMVLEKEPLKYIEKFL